MEMVISATELARKLGDYLARVRYRRDSVLVQKNGVDVARLVPVGDQPVVTVAQALAMWCATAPRDSEFADDLEKVNESDTLPENPWDS
ncbi:MAG TPA: type II toxin-antitoxin system prevent-host-death family antitoxin [Vicinamibacterales bacterium]|nr:type II toxin-antitoxin system prevent-host-death family antitoxin [Vicinamibacterales bacterium]